MEKFDSSKHLKYAQRLPFAYYSHPSYLDFAAYIFVRNGEHIIVSQDIYYLHEFPAIFMPQNKLNWENLSVTFATQEDLEKVEEQGIEIKIQKPVEKEFFYSTKLFIEQKESFLQRVNQFKRLYDYKILNNYPRNKIIKFYEKWKSQKARTGDTFEENEKFFFFCLDNLKKYSIRQVYVEVNSKLAGFAWGALHNKDNWIGLHLKADYQFKGLSRFMHHHRAKLFVGTEKFSLGTGAREGGISQYKEELGPILEKEYSYLYTGGKK